MKILMKRTTCSQLFLALLVLISAALFAGASSAAAGEHLDLDPQAESIIRRACDTIGGAGSFTFRADITYDDILESGERLRYSGELQSALRRPDGVRTDFSSGLDSSSAWYNGRSFTLFDTSTGLYATTPAPGQIDTLLEMVHEKLGFSLPLADFYYSDPYPGLVGNLERASYGGVEKVGETSCHRLDMSQEDIDWQIWIEEGDRALPRKLTITYKKLPGSPQYTAVFSDWDLSPALDLEFFTFRPPEGSAQIEFLPVQAESGPEGGGR